MRLFMNYYCDLDKSVERRVAAIGAVGHAVAITEVLEEAFTVGLLQDIGW